MQRLRRKFIWISLLLVTFICSQCKGPETSSIRNRTVLNIEEAYKYANLKRVLPNIAIKFNSTLFINESKHNVSGSIKVLNDSLLWFNLVSKSLGIEIARLKCTTDSLFLINRMDKKYYEGDYSYLSEKLGYNLSFKVIKNTFFGCLTDYSNDSLDYMSSNFLSYDKDSLYVFSYNFVDYLNSDSLNIGHYFKLNDNGNLLNSKFVNIFRNNSFEATYTSYTDNLPSNVILKIDSEKVKSELHFKYLSISNEVGNINYKVPSSYTKIK